MKRAFKHVRTEVVWLRNTNALDVAQALTNFLNLQRQATTQALLSGGLISAFEQVDREVFVVGDQLTNSLILSATTAILRIDDARY